MDRERAAAVRTSLGWLLAIGLLLLMILLPLSFAGLEYYEYGLIKSRTRGTVNADQVYGPGLKLYTGNPDATFQIYQADAHILEYEELSCVSKDRLEVKLDITAIYFLDKDALPSLQKQYNLIYEAAVESNALAAIKNTAVNFTLEDYFTRRYEVQKAMLEALRQVQESLFVEFRFFYITGMEISQDVVAKQLQTAIQNEINARQIFQNQAAGVRRETDAQVNSLSNEATATREKAESEAQSAIRQAQAEATKIVEAARVKAASKVFADLKLKTVAQMQQVDWMFGLLRRNDVRMRLGYQPQIVSTAG